MNYNKHSVVVGGCTALWVHWIHLTHTLKVGQHIVNFILPTLREKYLYILWDFEVVSAPIWERFSVALPPRVVRHLPASEKSRSSFLRKQRSYTLPFPLRDLQSPRPSLPLPHPQRELVLFISAGAPLLHPEVISEDISTFKRIWMCCSGITKSYGDKNVCMM